MSGGTHPIAKWKSSVWFDEVIFISGRALRLSMPKSAAEKTKHRQQFIRDPIPCLRSAFIHSKETPFQLFSDVNEDFDSEKLIWHPPSIFESAQELPKVGSNCCKGLAVLGVYGEAVNSNHNLHLVNHLCR